MQVIVNAMIVGRSSGDNEVVVVNNMNTGAHHTVFNPHGIAVELGQEGTLLYKESETSHIISFQPLV